ncbi:MAG: amidase [Hyphomonadaceae bacterium]|nr:amidase [Hyphomonadaceae bacterium]
MKHLLVGAALAAICAGCSTDMTAPQIAVAEDAKEMTYTPSPLLAQTLPELSDGLAAGDITAVELVTAYQNRIEAVDRNGPTLQSVLALNPNALADAEASDARRAAGEALGPLDGIPILLKDNIESLDPVATTAGALALKDNVTGRDSPLVAGLRAQGAIILGKTNLSQWANFRSNDSMSGWSALGGQVRNPHMLDRNPCGSSSGSGAAAAASLAAGTVGTETNGSIICPSNVNGIVGFKPTVGLVPQDYIVPISSSQDTAGPMTKSVKGAALMMNAMASGDMATDYVAALDAGSLSGQRVGVLRFAEGSSADIQARFNAALEVLEAQGAVLVEIEEFSPDGDNYWGDALSVLHYEFKHTLNEYLASTPETVTARTLAELIEFNKANAEIELALFDQSIFDASEAKGPITDEDYVRARDAIQSATRENGIDKLLTENDVAMLVSPSGPLSPRVDPVNGDTWPAWAGAGYLAAVAGYPHVTVPMGSVHGVPIGFSIMGAKDADADILSWGYAFEQASQMRVEPQYLPNAEARPEIAAAMAAK